MYFNGFTLLLCLLSFAGGFVYRSRIEVTRKHYAEIARQRILASDTPVYDQLASEWDF
jgi:hypothetical protein